MKKQLVSILAVAALAGCAGYEGPSKRPPSNLEGGAILGGIGGAVVGAIAYKKDRSKGALVGAIGGALAGGAVGSYMDNQKRDLEKNLAQEIQSGQARIDKLPDDVVRITMTSQTAFETDSSTIKPGFNSTMDKVADVVARYQKTTLTVVGHTDNVGTNDYNQKLSERRAHSVAQYLESRRVDGMRLALSGKGETQPISNNTTESGRQANRRVEIYVEPVVQG